MKPNQIQTLKNILISSIGTVLAGLLSFLFFILLSRGLGPLQFGIFSSLVAIAGFISDVSDGGVSAALPYFIGKSYLKKGESINKLLTGLLILRIFPISVFILIAIFFAKLIIGLIFNNIIINPLSFYLTVVGAIILSLFSFWYFALQAKRRYFVAQITNLFGNTTRLALLLLVVFVGVIDLELSLAIYFVGLLISLIFASFFLPPTYFSRPTKREFHQIFKFNRWLAVGALLFVVFTRLDVVLVSSLSTVEQAGFYAAASKITFFFPLLISALSAVWSPVFSQFKNITEAIAYLKNSIFLVLIFTPLSILVPLLLSQKIILLFFGSQYLGAVQTLTLQIIAWFFFLLSVPVIQFITYYLGRSDIYAILTIEQFLVILTFDIFLIPKFGATGAALAFLSGNLVYLLSTYLFGIFLKAGFRQFNFGKEELLPKQ